jgi:hypothetical protein
MDRAEKINRMAEIIRQVDGDHTMGASALAEAIVDTITATNTATADADPPTEPDMIPPVGSVVVTADHHVMIRRSEVRIARNEDGTDTRKLFTFWDSTDELKDNWSTDSTVSEWLLSGRATVLRVGETMITGVVPRDAERIDAVIDAMSEVDDSACPLSLAAAIVDADGRVGDGDVNPPAGSVVVTADHQVMIRRSEIRISQDEDGTDHEIVFTFWDTTDENADRFEVDATVREWLASGSAIMLRCGVTPIPHIVPSDFDTLLAWLSTMSRVDRYRIASLIANRATGSRLSAYTDAEVYAVTTRAGGRLSHTEAAEWFGMTVDMVHARCTRHRRRLGIVTPYARRDGGDGAVA